MVCGPNVRQLPSCRIPELERDRGFQKYLRKQAEIRPGQIVIWMCLGRIRIDTN